MGLDMYLDGERYYMHRTETSEVKSDRVKLGYWRKHPNLHGYIVQTFADAIDDCKEIELGTEALEQIIEAVKANRLPHTQGFFFGESPTEANEVAEQIKDDVEIFSSALAWLNADTEAVLKSVYYRASW